MNTRLALCCTALTLGLTAGNASAGSSLGARLWYADTDGADSPALLVGPTVSLGLGENVQLVAVYMQGKYDYPNTSVRITDAEAVLGFTTAGFNFGLGARHTTWDFRDDDLTIWGPLVSLGFGDVFGQGPVGWYIAGSYMFLDLGDLKDSKDFSLEHWNAEAGLFLSLEHFMINLGYRIREYNNWDFGFDGVAAGVSVRF